MKSINITNVPLFDNIAIMEIENEATDLHNDYDFKSLLLNENTNNLELIFSKNSNPTIILKIKFECVEIKKISIQQLTYFDNITLDNLYRGKYEINGVLLEKNHLNQSYFYLDFLENIQFEFWALSVIYERY